GDVYATVVNLPSTALATPVASAMWEREAVRPACKVAQRVRVSRFITNVGLNAERPSSGAQRATFSRWEKAILSPFNTPVTGRRGAIPSLPPCQGAAG